jgi:hypothetical protein
LDEDGSIARDAFEAAAIVATTGSVPWSVTELGVTSGTGPEGGTSLFTTPLVGAVFETASEEGASVPLPFSAAEGLKAPRAIVKRFADNLKEEQIKQFPPRIQVTSVGQCDLPDDSWRSI